MMFIYALGLFVAISAIFIRYSARRRQYSKVVPSEDPSFFNVLGDLKYFWTFSNIHQNIMHVLTSRSKMFQKQGLMCIWMFYIPLVLLLKAESVKVVLKSGKMLDKGWMYEWMKPVVGEGLLTSAGEKWKFQKRMLTPCFRADVVRNFIASFNEGSQTLVRALRDETTKDFTYIAEKITLCTLEIAAETICGVTLGAQENEKIAYLQSMRKIASTFMERIFSPFIWPDYFFFNSNLGREMVNSKKIMQEITRSIIEEKRKRYLNGEKITVNGKRKAMLDLLLEKHFETQELSEEDIREQVDVFLIAGHETLSTTITWALFLLGNHPEAQAKVHEEVDRIFGDDLEREVTEEDFKDLSYLDCVVKETLRLYPGIPIFAREAPEDMEINGYPIPKGTACAVFVFSLHRDEDVFPDPEKFDPDRFSPERRGNIPEFAYVPFSGGQRNCIGYKFAEIEIRIILTWIMRNFTVKSLDSVDKVKPIMCIGMHSSVPIKMKFAPRSIPKPA